MLAFYEHGPGLPFVLSRERCQATSRSGSVRRNHVQGRANRGTVDRAARSSSKSGKAADCRAAYDDRERGSGGDC